MKYIIISLLFTLGILFFSGCSKDSPAIEQKKFVEIYSEMLIIQDTTSLSQAEIRKSVLKKFKVSINDFKSMIEYYNSRPELWQKFFDDVLVFLETKKKNLKNLDEQSLQEQFESEDN